MGKDGQENFLWTVRSTSPIIDLFLPLVEVQLANSDLILLQVNLQPGIDNCKMVPVSITSDESIDSRHSFFSSESLKSASNLTCLFLKC